MLSEKVTFSLPCLKSLVTSENSCVYCKSNYKRSLILLPLHLQDLKQSVREILASKVTTYDIELGGIILSHKNVKICSSVEMNDDGHFTLEYLADIYIFTPEIGCTLNGRINKKGRDVLGCLVHSVFNVALPRPRNDDDSPKKWKGSKAFIGQNVTFTVVKLDFTGRLPYIRGQLLKLEDKGESDDDGADSGMGYQESNDDCRITSVIRDDPQTSSVENKNYLHSSKRKRNSSGSITDSPKARKKRFLGNSSDEGLSGEGSLCTDHLLLDISKRSSNNEREKGENSSTNFGVANIDEGILKIKEEPIDSTATELNTVAKSKKKKKEKKNHSSLTDFEGLSSTLLKEALAKTRIKTEDTSSEDTSQAAMHSSSKKSKVSKTDKHSKGKVSENLENLSLSLLKEAMEINQHLETNTEIIKNNLLKDNDGRDEMSGKKKKKEKKHLDIEDVEHRSKEKLKTVKQTVASEDSKNIAARIDTQKEKANVDNEPSSKRLIQTKLRPVTVKQEVEEMGVVKKKKKKHKESDGMRDISSALLEQAIKDLSVKIEDVKQESDEHLSAINVSTKTSSKRKKSKEGKKES